MQGLPKHTKNGIFGMQINHPAILTETLKRRSTLTPEALSRIPPERHSMYQRIWDESDYVIPPAENR
jgi:hypothetical protein